MFAQRKHKNMLRKTFQFDYDVCDLSDLSSTERDLVEAAQKACETSYAPYSHFHVGAAALLEDGTIFIGSNQENASFTVGTCAERCTIYAAHAHYPASRIPALAIAAKGCDGKFLELPITPCGACRQALLEIEQYQESPMHILLYGTECIYRLEKAADLLPLHFDSEALS